MRYSIFLSILILSLNSFAQRIDSYSKLFEIPDSSFVRFQYDNDLFQRQDVYYTQGVCLEIVNPLFRKNPLNYILLSSSHSSFKKTGMRIETAAFSPSSILSDSILFNDRPYSAMMALNFYQMSYFIERSMKLTSDFQIGVIGPAALGKEIQTGIHRITNNSLPHGWGHQIQNDIILNYSVRLDKQLLGYRSLIALNGLGQINLGTYQTNVVAGLDLSFGHKNNIFSATTNKFQYFIYAQSKLKLIGYDASLMGGVFNHSSDYTLSYSTLNKLVAEEHLGFVLQLPHVYFGADFGFISREFTGGKTHAWGGLRLGFY